MPVTGTLEEFFSAIQECERLYPVSRWSVHGVPVWPFIRTEGRQELSESLPSSGNKIASRSFIFSLLRHATSPLADVIENYRDWQHEKLRLRPVDALVLGDGISRDVIEGAWRDRYGAPIIAALEAIGKTSLLMQPRRQILPRERETYSVQWIASWGHLAGRIFQARTVDLPGHAEVQALRQAAGALANYRLPGATLYVTLEPCAMCAGAILLSRLEAVVWGAKDMRMGANGSWVDLFSCNFPMHTVAIRRGVFEEWSQRMLKEFFKKKRVENGT